MKPCSKFEKILSLPQQFPHTKYFLLKHCQKHGKNKKNNIDEYLSMLDFQSGKPYESTQQI